MENNERNYHQTACKNGIDIAAMNQFKCDSYKINANYNEIMTKHQSQRPLNPHMIHHIMNLNNICPKHG